MLRDLLPARLPDDVWAGRLVIRLGGRPWILPVLTMAASDTWRQEVTMEAGQLWQSLGAASDMNDVLLALSHIERDTLRRLLLSYDDGQQLPQEASWWYETCTDIEVLRAFVEVLAVANPTLAAVLTAALTMPQVLAQVVASAAPAVPGTGSPTATAGSPQPLANH